MNHWKSNKLAARDRHTLGLQSSCMSMIFGCWGSRGNESGTKSNQASRWNSDSIQSLIIAKGKQWQLGYKPGEAPILDLTGMLVVTFRGWNCGSGNFWGVRKKKIALRVKTVSFRPFLRRDMSIPFIYRKTCCPLLFSHIPVLFLWMKISKVTFRE